MGEFLALLCELGQNRGVGFDPAYVDERGRPHVGGGFSVIKDLYSERYVEYQADFFCCRMTLEHIAEPLALIGVVRRAIGGRDGTLLLQVPSVMRILQEGAFWDIYYEHCSYYGHASLTQLLRRCAFDPIRSETVYDGQYLVMEAGPAPEGPAEEIREKDLGALMRAIGHFAASVHAGMTAWRGALGEMARSGRTAVWGSGSKAVAFLTTLGVRDEVEYVVDINPYRQGTFLPGTGQPIVAPEHLRQNPPDHVIVMNPVYRKEITGALAAMELTPRVLTP
jgi:hypothetical protein